MVHAGNQPQLPHDQPVPDSSAGQKVGPHVATVMVDQDGLPPKPIGSPDVGDELVSDHRDLVLGASQGDQCILKTFCPRLPVVSPQAEDRTWREPHIRQNAANSLFLPLLSRKCRVGEDGEPLDSPRSMPLPDRLDVRNGHVFIGVTDCPIPVHHQPLHPVQNGCVRADVAQVPNVRRGLHLLQFDLCHLRPP